MTHGPDTGRQLPRWLAVKGPPPGWLAEHWSRILAALSAVAVLLNTLVTFPGIDGNAEKWINAAVAWVAAAALWLQSRQQQVGEIARWRAHIRAHDEARHRHPAGKKANGTPGAGIGNGPAEA